MKSLDYYRKINNAFNVPNQKEVEVMKARNLMSVGFKDSPAYYQVNVFTSTTSASLPVDVWITSSSNSASSGDIKNIISLNTINNGDIFAWQDGQWMIDNVDFVGEIYYRASVRKCNATVRIQTGTTNTMSGYDKMNRPVYNQVPIYGDFPAIVTSKLQTTKSSDQAINLPIGQVLVEVQYGVPSKFERGAEVSIYDREWTVRDVDMSKTYNNKGILVFLAELKV